MIIKPFTDVTLTDAAVLSVNANDFLEDKFEGTFLFAITGTKVTGTFDVTAQLQFSQDNTNWINSGSPVTMSDTVTSQLVEPNAGVLRAAYYRVTLTGSGTQSTTIAASYSRKSK